jgi:hypothetical protein
VGLVDQIIEKLSPIDDVEIDRVYQKVEQIKLSTLETHAHHRRIQAEEIKRAAELSPSEEETRRLEEVAKIAERKAREAEREVMVRKEHLQAIVDVQLGRK